MESKGVVLVLGGDGFCGWATALHLLDSGYEVAIVDSIVRRQTDEQLGTCSLVPIYPIRERIAACRSLVAEGVLPEWCEGLHVYYYDLASQAGRHRLKRLIKDTAPVAIVHMAEQRSAPYSMLNESTKAYTIRNNTEATHNVCMAMLGAAEQYGVDTHLVHIGTAGVYGYGAIEGGIVPEGYINARMFAKGSTQQIDCRIPHPFYPGSVYHLTKCIDNTIFQYYARVHDLKITDLHQGIIWGASTPMTDKHPHLANRFDYDGEYGTVLNRFLVQAAIKHPLTVYGTGGQTRAFIHLRDSVQCVGHAIAAPDYKRNPKEVRVFNQSTEEASIAWLAEKVSRLSGVPICKLRNPRVEKSENTLYMRRDWVEGLGIAPTLLSNEAELAHIISQAHKHRARVRCETIKSRAVWDRRKVAP